MNNDLMKQFSIATKGIIFYDGKFLIVKRSKKYSNAFSWEFPGGSMETGETFEDCLLREIKEEAGLNVTIKGYLYSWKILRQKTDTVGFTYLCETDSNTVNLSDEHTDYAWITPSEIHKYNLSEGIISDLSTIDWNYINLVLTASEKEVAVSLA